jgi:hypothetical protein
VTQGGKNILADTDVEVTVDDKGATLTTSRKEKKYKDLTKICFEILNETDHDLVLEKAFLKNRFNETRSSAEALRELYLYVCMSEQMDNATKYTASDNKDKVNKCNNIAKGFTVLLDEVVTDTTTFAD